MFILSVSLSVVKLAVVSGNPEEARLFSSTPSRVRMLPHPALFPGVPRRSPQGASFSDLSSFLMGSQSHVSRASNFVSRVRPLRESGGGFGRLVGALGGLLLLS